MNFSVDDALLARIHTAINDQEAITLYAEDPSHLEVFVGEFDADEDEPLGVVEITAPQLVTGAT